MTTITANANAARETGFFRRLGDAVADFFEAVVEARRMADRYDYLSRMSDRELADIGLTREEIPQRVARGL